MTSGQNESHSLRGPVDRPALIAIRDLFTQNEPLATATLDDFLNPRTLEVQYEDGLLSADQSRIDIQWTTRNDYTYHYTIRIRLILSVIRRRCPNLSIFGRDSWPKE